MTRDEVRTIAITGAVSAVGATIGTLFVEALLSWARGGEKALVIVEEPPPPAAGFGRIPLGGPPLRRLGPVRQVRLEERRIYRR